MKWKIGDLFVSSKTNKTVEIIGFTKISDRIEIAYVMFNGNIKGSIWVSALGKYWREATNREKFLYYVGVNDLNEDI